MMKNKDFKLLKGYQDPMVNLLIRLERLTETLEKLNETTSNLNKSLISLSDTLRNL